jgi:hypothetical protein
MRQKLLLLFLLFLSVNNAVHAQHFRFSHYDPGAYNSLSEFGRQEIRIGIGVLSSDQLKGISSREQTKFDFPKTISTAIALGYRFYPLNWMAASLTGVVDYQSGNTTDYYANYPAPASGSYDRCSWSAALGLTFIYVDDFGFQMYGGLEGGYTLYKANTHFEAVAPLHVQETYPCWQVTALGLKSNGPFAVFFELGYGYRGMIILGVAGRF